MKNTRYFVFLMIFIFALSCKNDDNNSGENWYGADNEVNSFIWSAMNLWYYWQPETADLADSKDDDTNSFVNYLNSFSSPEDLFNSLKNTDDRFSGLFSDYRDLDNAFAGNFTDPGHAFKLLLYGDDMVLGVITYINPNTPAEAAGLKRGDIFIGVDGTDMNLDNYQSLLSKTDFTLNMASITDNVITPTIDVELTSASYTEDAVHYYSVLDIGGKKIGYLMYNSFDIQSHKKLAEVFQYFKNNGVTEDLILDLRYNGGGYVTTELTLAGLISSSNQGEIFTEVVYNGKINDGGTSKNYVEDKLNFFNENFEVTSTSSLEGLDIKNLVVLTTSSTASASEATILGFNPKINVTIVGTETTGKSNTNLVLYDNSINYYQKPVSDVDGAINPNHFYAVYAVIGVFANPSGENVPVDGFVPVGDNLINELDFIGDEGLAPIGDYADPLLAKGLESLGVTVPSGRWSLENADFMLDKAEMELTRKHGLNESALLNGLDLSEMKLN